MAGQRFPKAHRVRKRRDFLRVQRTRERIASRHFVVLVSPSPPSPSEQQGHERPLAARLGLVASRRIGGAVERNRGKRLVREWFRRRSSALPKGSDLVVILRAGAPALALAEVCEELDGALRRLSARRGKPSQACRATSRKRG